MANITKIQIRDFVKGKLGTDDRWAKQALLKIYQFQTEEEQESEYTKEDNGIGFTGVDGMILSSFAKQLERKKFLSPKQMKIVFRKMPKYWKQIIAISDDALLIKLIQKS
jgi:hypothetical protein